jgi:hypothetical protein
MKHLHYKISVSFIRTALVALSMVTFVDIAGAQDKDGNIGKIRQGLTAKNVRNWTENGNVVPVCWETPGYTREKTIVTNAVTRTWEKYALISFTGWGACPNSGPARQVRIRITAQDGTNAGAAGSTRGYGMELLSSAADNNPGVNLSFIPDGTADKGRVEYVGVHEFGHVLTFVHEQDTPGNEGPAYCLSSGNEPNATSITPYDRDSIMNYCNKDGNAFGNLTDYDIAGVQKIYGARLQFIGTFGKTPANYQPIWVYAINNNGDLLWYRKDTGESAWQGPKKVGSGWDYYKDVIPAGGNSVYGLADDGTLNWYQHNGFNNGVRDWKKAVEIGHGWRFARIFSGGEGIIYAIKADGTLLWYRHGGYADGGGALSGPRVIGSGWGQFTNVFSMGQGAIYAVKPNGDLVLYQHNGFANGDPVWGTERVVSAALQGSRQINSAIRGQIGVTALKPVGWQNFRQIIPAGGGVILAITADGKLLRFKHLGLTRSVGFGPLKETWEGPVEIGSGWQGLKKVFALLPVASAPVVR